MLRQATTPARHSRRGFTLVEIMLVVTLLGILAAVVLPSMSASDRGLALESAAQTLLADLRLARHAAVQYGTSYTIAFDVAGNAYAISNTGSGAAPPLIDPLAPNEIVDGTDFDFNGAGRPGQARVYLSGAALKVSKTSVANVTFGPTGGTGPTRTQDTVVWLTEGQTNERRCIVLTISWITGNVTMGDLQTFPLSQSMPTF